jgi:hypothetical protein
MVIAGQRAYANAVRWVASTRPQVRRWIFARRAVRSALVAATLVLGLIALVDPARFGAPGTRTLRTGWPSTVVIALVLACSAYALVKRRAILSVVSRMREPYLRPLKEMPGFEEAADALASCPAPFKLRFAARLVWRPLALVVLAVTCAFSTSYFVIDAVLARGLVGWGQVLYSGVFLLAALCFFALAATGLSTWRVSASVYKEVTSGY